MARRTQLSLTIGFLGRLVRRGLSVLIVLSASANAIAQSGQDGVCSTVNIPGAVTVTAQGINNSGAVVGSYRTSDFVTHGYIYSGGQITTLNAPDSLWTAAFGINDAGVVVGAYGPATPICNCVDDIEVHGFKYVNGAFTTFDVGLSQTWPMAINSAGTIVGFYNDRDGDIEDAKRGFLLSPSGGLTRIDAPGGGPLTDVYTIVRGINDAGVAVGFYFGDGVGTGGVSLGGEIGVAGGGRGFTWRDGAFTELRHPESPEQTGLYGINNDETIVGTYAPSDSSGDVSFRFASNRFSMFDCFETTENPPQPEPDPELPTSGPSLGASLQPGGAGPAQFTALNNRGAMVGNRFGANGVSQAFYTAPISFADPIPRLMRRGTALITTVPDVLATQGRYVQGIAADGVSQIVIRIPMSAAQQSVTVKIYKTTTEPIGTGEMNEYGALGRPGEPCPGDGCDEIQLTVQSSTTNDGAMAFVVYRAPADFVRTSADAGLKSREIYLRVESSSGVVTMPVRVVRPPVVLLHGMWSNVADTWSDFAPLAWGANGADARFGIIRIDYGTPVPPGSITNLYPWYESTAKATYSSFGIDVNAKRVFDKVREEMHRFKDGANPLRIPIAAVQADFVAHSMGGVIARYLSTSQVEGVLLRLQMFNRGIVHKLITVATPHRGSPVGRKFLQFATDGNPDHRCFADFLARHGSYVLDTVVTTDFGQVRGAASDLKDIPLSQALSAIAASSASRPIPTALLIGIYTQWWSLDFIPAIYRFLCPDDPMALALTEEGWPVVMEGPSDGIVPQSSAHPEGPGITYTGFTHSDGMLLLGFELPTMTSNPSIPTTVIDLLNTPASNQTYYGCLPTGQCGQ